MTRLQNHMKMNTFEVAQQLPSYSLEACMANFHIECRLSYEVTEPTDFIFMIHAAHHPQQRICTEELILNENIEPHVFVDAAGFNRVLRAHVPTTNEFSLIYRSEIEVYPLDLEVIEQLPECAIVDLPNDVIPYLWSSRYCPTEMLMRMAQRTFGHLPKGYSRVYAITEWVHEHIAYVVGSSNPQTTAADVLLQQAGVCRDFAHLAITLCRCLNIPARLVVGYVEFDEPPPDFHAVFEAYLGDRWVLFDPTKMAPIGNVVRIAAGRDAVEVAFCSSYGNIKMLTMQPMVCDAIPNQEPHFQEGDTLDPIENPSVA